MVKTHETDASTGPKNYYNSTAPGSPAADDE